MNNRMKVLTLVILGLGMCCAPISIQANEEGRSSATLMEQLDQTHPGKQKLRRKGLKARRKAKTKMWTARIKSRSKCRRAKKH